MISAEILRKLADIGFMATSGGFFRQAESIFKAIELNKKNNVLPYMGMALNLMNMEKGQEALDILEKKALKIEPDNHVLQAFKAMALMLLGRNSESETCLNGIVAKSTDDLAQNLAKNLLSELHRSDK